MTVLDRTEQGKAVLLQDDKQALVVEIDCLAPECRQGDVVVLQEDGLWHTDLAATQKEREKSQHLLKQLQQG